MNLSTVVGAVALLGLGAASQVQAGCGDTTSPAALQESAAFVPALYRPAAFTDTGFTLVSHEEQSASIVGIWKFEWLSDGKSKSGPPAGVLLDFGLQAWHDDGTEIMNSGNQNPADSNFCMGAWQQVGRSTFRLNHIPLAYNGGNYVGPVKITETVTVSPSGNKFTGTVSITPYLATKTPGHEFDETTPLVPEAITGTVTATRLSAF
jgi:hypothetical protein